MNDDLRAAAQAATPGPWEQGSVRRGMIGHPDSDQSWWLVARVAQSTANDRGKHDAAYIALASPDRILALCEENKELRAALERIVEFADGTNVWDEYRVDGMLERVAEGRAALEGKPTE